MNSLEFDIIYLKYKLYLFTLLLLFSIGLFLFILFCNICTENIMIDYLILIISASIVLMIISTYYIIATQLKIDFINSINDLVDIEDLNINHEYDSDEYNNEL